MICDTCIHKEVCYENEEDRKALKHCSDYFNYAEELEKIKAEINEQRHFNMACCGRTDLHEAINIINSRIEELKGKNE